jgi:hypothetical protein
MNPIAIVFWIFCAGIGYLIGDTDGAIIGAVIAMGLSLAATAFSK